MNVDILDENLKLFRQLLCGALPDEERSVLTQLIKCLDAQEHAEAKRAMPGEACSAVAPKSAAARA